MSVTGGVPVSGSYSMALTFTLVVVTAAIPEGRGKHVAEFDDAWQRVLLSWLGAFGYGTIQWWG
jgi:hypothetical protein